YSSFAASTAASTPYPLSFFFNATATTEIYTLSLHDALPISSEGSLARRPKNRVKTSMLSTGCKMTHRTPIAVCLYRIFTSRQTRSEENTSELQSRFDLVCRLLLEKKKKNKQIK